MMMSPRAQELAHRLWMISLLRGLAAVALAAWVLAVPPASPAGLTRAVAAYWVLEGLVVLVGGLSTATLVLNRILFVLRALAGIITALAILALPLSEVFGAYEPGQFMLLLVVIPLVIGAIALQALAAAFDLLICLEVRRRIPGEWSVALASLLSPLFGVCLVVMLLVPPHVLGRGVGAIGLAGGLALVTGALRLRPARRRSLHAVLR